MSAEELVLGMDGKRYRAHQRTDRELDLVVHRTHQLRHEGHLSERAIVRELARRYGIRRSAGAVHRDLTVFPCERCGQQA